MPTDQHPSAALDELDGGRSPLPPRHPTQTEIDLGHGYKAAIKRRPPRAALKAKAALAKVIGPTFGRLLLAGVTLDGRHYDALAIFKVFRSSTYAEELATDGVDVNRVRSAAKANLVPILIEALAELEPEALDDLIEYQLVGACAVWTGETWVPIRSGEQLDQHLPHDMALGAMLVEAIKMGFAPFVGPSSPPV